MSWYRDYKEQWKEIIETVAAEEHRTTQMVEKDTMEAQGFVRDDQGVFQVPIDGKLLMKIPSGMISRLKIRP